MPWFALYGDERLGRCATENCGGQPIYRLEAGGAGSNYCSGCQAAIRKNVKPLHAPIVITDPSD